MTKKDAAARLFYVARLIRVELEGDEAADTWAMLIDGIAHDLDPQNPRYVETYSRASRIALRVKLRRLIEHPETPQHEREAAVRALYRLAERTEEGAP